MTQTILGSVLIALNLAAFAILLINMFCDIATRIKIRWLDEAIREIEQESENRGEYKPSLDEYMEWRNEMERKHKEENER